MLKKGLFIVIDGIDGCGSTTHCKLLSDYLKERKFKVKLTKEPTDSMIGILSRRMLRGKNLSPLIDALLFSADRQQHTKEIQKHLNDGYVVICDRYLESTIAYQSSQGLSIDWLLELNKDVIKPNLTFILDIDPKLALARKHLDNPEKFEKVEFLTKVRQVYIDRKNKNNYLLLNSNRNIVDVQTTIRIYVDLKINNNPNIIVK